MAGKKPNNRYEVAWMYRGKSYAMECKPTDADDLLKEVAAARTAETRDETMGRLIDEIGGDSDNKNSWIPLGPWDPSATAEQSKLPAVAIADYNIGFKGEARHAFPLRIRKMAGCAALASRHQPP